jgi:hypothetical protein
MRTHSVAAFVAATCFYSFQVAAITVDLTSTGMSITDFRGTQLIYMLVRLHKKCRKHNRLWHDEILYGC